MKKILTYFFLIPTLTLAQKSYVVQTFDVVIPNETLKSSATTGWGSSFYFEHAIVKRVSAFASMGFVQFGKKSYTTSSPPIYTLETKITMFPIQLGAKYYFFDYSGEIQKGLFASGELGVHVLTGSAKINGINETPPNETDFSYALGLGYRINKVEFCFRQQFIAPSGKTSSYTGLRFAWLFLKKKR